MSKHYRFTWDQIQPWMLDLIQTYKDGSDWLSKPKRLPRLAEQGEFFWCWLMARYFAAITPEQRTITINRLSAQERALILLPKRKQDFIAEEEYRYKMRMRGVRDYAKLTPEERAAKIEAARLRNGTPRGRAHLRLPAEVIQARQKERSRKEAKDRYQRIKADPERYARYLERKRNARRKK